MAFYWLQIAKQAPEKTPRIVCDLRIRAGDDLDAIEKVRNRPLMHHAEMADLIWLNNELGDRVWELHRIGDGFSTSQQSRGR